MRPLPAALDPAVVSNIRTPRTQDPVHPWWAIYFNLRGPLDV